MISTKNWIYGTSVRVNLYWYSYPKLMWRPKDDQTVILTVLLEFIYIQNFHWIKTAPLKWMVHASGSNMCSVPYQFSNTICRKWKKNLHSIKFQNIVPCTIQSQRKTGKHCIKLTFNLSIMLAWSINLYLFVVWIKNLACSFAGIIPSQRETCHINQIQLLIVQLKDEIWNKNRTADNKNDSIGHKWTSY